MEYKAANKWYLLHTLGVLPFALMIYISYRKDDNAALLTMFALLFIFFTIATSYRIYKQTKTPIITTDDEEILVRVTGFKEKRIKWDVITDVEAGKSNYKVNIFGKQESIPINALNAQDKEAFINEVNARIIK